MAKKTKTIKADEDLSEGLPTPDHISEANEIPDGIIFKKDKTIKVRKVNKKK